MLPLCHANILPATYINVYCPTTLLPKILALNMLQYGILEFLKKIYPGVHATKFYPFSQRADIVTKTGTIVKAGLYIYGQQ